MSSPSTKSDEKRFACPMCGIRFYSKKGLDWHKETDHDEPASPPRHIRL